MTSLLASMERKTDTYTAQNFCSADALCNNVLGGGAKSYKVYFTFVMQYLTPNTQLISDAVQNVFITLLWQI